MILPETLENSGDSWQSVRHQGFSLIELLVVMVIGIMLAVLAVPIATNLPQTSTLADTSSLLIQNLRSAAERSRSRLHNARHGVYVETAPGVQHFFTLYEGASYATRDADYDRTIAQPDSIRFSATEQDFNFSPVAGTTTPGSITVMEDAGDARTIIINEFGAVGEG